MTLDMTRGPAVRRMLLFALPLMLSSMLQQLYTMFDSMIVGKLLGSDAFAAIASAGYLNSFPVNLIFGASIGFGVALSHRFGAKDPEEFRRCFASSILLSLLLGLVVTVLGMTMLARLLALVKTPSVFEPFAHRYILALWPGLIFTALYNVFAAALRGMGDSKSPFYALIASTLINIALDFFLIGVFKMHVEGAALATVLSQFASAVWCLFSIKKPVCFQNAWTLRFRAPYIQSLSAWAVRTCSAMALQGRAKCSYCLQSTASASNLSRASRLRGDISVL